MPIDPADARALHFWWRCGRDSIDLKWRSGSGSGSACRRFRRLAEDWTSDPQARRSAKKQQGEYVFALRLGFGGVIRRAMHCVSPANRSRAILAGPQILTI